MEKYGVDKSSIQDALNKKEKEKKKLEEQRKKLEQILQKK